MPSKPRADNNTQLDQGGAQALTLPETGNTAAEPDDSGDKAPRMALPPSLPGAIKLLIIFGLSGALWWLVIWLVASLVG